MTLNYFTRIHDILVALGGNQDVDELLKSRLNYWVWMKV